ncbi:MAG: tRNA epoxyqueuosine(34) reductase QueG [Anaerolineae bacterium]
MTVSAKALKQFVQTLGFNLVGVTHAEPSPTLNAYQRWIEAGMHGKMAYLAREDRRIRRENLNHIVDGARSIVMVGLDYRSSFVPAHILNDPTRGRIASYAWQLDYHDLMEPRLELVADWLAEQSDGLHKVYVDTGAVLERSHAQQAGMGFIGKNTMLIHPQRGSYFFLGELISTLEFDTYDSAHQPTMCGTCTRCLEACPTDAFPQPYVLDARRCISYHTIENKDWIDRELRPLFGNWVYGCDVCQEVCPFQRFSVATHESAFYPDNFDNTAPLLRDLLMLDDASFRARFKDSPIYRIKRKRLVRNACIAVGNSGDPQFIPYLIQLLYDQEALVRGHAVWALWQLMGHDALSQLSALYDREEDALVRAEIEALVP